MIKVDSIAIKEFRGIRDLTLDFQGKCFAVCGANGTGKSGVVDALEFGLTGNVSRLSGEGRGEVSLKEHGPHVDFSTAPDKATVTLSIELPVLHKKVTVTRNLEAPGKAIVNPSEPSVLAVLQQAENHPEIVLSRRELIRYVLATPGKRAEEVQALLQLSKVEQVRTSLQKIANSHQRNLPPLDAALTQANENLKRALVVPDLTPERILAATNEQRRLLRLPVLTEFSASTSLNADSSAPAAIKAQRIPKNQASADIQAVRNSIGELRSAATVERATRLTADFTSLGSDPEFEESISRESFYEIGLKLLTTNECPFCDLPWDMGQLKEHVQSKIDRLEMLSQRRKKLETELEPLIAIVRKLKDALTITASYAENGEEPSIRATIHGYITSCDTMINKLTALLPLAEAIEVLKNIAVLPETVIAAIEKVDKIVAALPEPTVQDAAISWLAVAQERLDVVRNAEKKQQIAKVKAQIAHEIFDTYAKTSDAVLTGIYEAVEKDFASLYGFLHRNDETSFKAKLIPSMGKLGFDVDFYGRGLFPPGAYHSEGHQDCMGLCLYLALMKHLQGDAFTLAILDDVLMSVDTGHRREICTLLKSQFPNTQFIMTTHDPIWLKHMRTEGLIQGRSAVQFRNWDVDHGPIQWDDKDIWTEISEILERNDVRASSALLRYFLEYISQELCHRLRAPVPFRSDDRYELGELLPAAVSHLQKLYGSAKAAANSWNQREVIDLIVDRASTFGKLANSSNVEQWQINAAVHYNTWANLIKEDFKPVVKSFKELLAGFMCLSCNEYLRVSPGRETPESLRCECGKIAYNLKKKDA